jgi:predicted nuclease of predicted toxin-antitoxin system
MNLYLDDNAADAVLIALLRRAGHDVEIPAAAGLAGARDPVHLAHAVRQGRVILSWNYEDFEPLHDLVMVVQGHHPGIFIVRRDNDPRRDLKNPEIVRAIGNLLAAGVPIADCCHILNHWR